jgi:sugar lactone lactonase YvrE
VADGLLIANGTNHMYITAVEENAIRMRDLDEGPQGQPRVVAQDAQLRWPDTFTQGPDGTIYVTSSHIQDSSMFKPDAPNALPTQLWRLAKAD